MGRRTKVVLTVVGALAVGVAGWWGWQLWQTRQETALAAPAASYRMVRAERGPISLVISASGAVEPAGAEDIRADGSGEVAELYLQEGQQVSQGQVVANLANETLALNLEKAQLNLGQARDQLAKMEKQIYLQTVTFPQGGRLEAVKVTEGQGLSQNALLATLLSGAGQLVEVLAPVPGLVSGLSAGAGQQVQAGQLFLTLENYGAQASAFANLDKARLSLEQSRKQLAELEEQVYRQQVTFPQAGQVEAVKVAQGQGVTQNSLLATLRNNAGQLVEVVAPVPGLVSGLAAGPGQQVQAGQLLLSLENYGADAATFTNLEKAHLNLEQVRKQLADLESDLQTLEISFPVAGRLEELRVQDGQEVGKNALLATVLDDSLLNLTVNYNSAQAKQLQEGQAMRVFMTDFLSSLPGKLTRLQPLSYLGDKEATTYQATVELANPGALQPGQEALVYAPIAGGELQSLNGGQLKALEPVEVKTGVAGTVAGLRVQAGDVVRAGQPFLTLENPGLADSQEEQRVKVRQAERDVANLISQIRENSGESLEDQRLKVRQAEADVENQLQQLRENTETNLEAQRLKVRQAEMDGENLEQQLNKSVITAPANGEVVDVAVKVGDEVKVGTVLGRVVDYQRLQVVLPIDELDISRIEVSQNVAISSEALAGQKFIGRISQVAREGKSQSGVATYDVTVAIDSPGALRAGMTVDASIQVAAKEDALLLPVTAVQDYRGQKVVVLPGESESGAQAPTFRSQPVETGLYSEQWVEITQGLKEGEEVLLAPDNNAAVGGASPAGRPGGVLPGMPGMGRVPSMGGFGGGGSIRVAPQQNRSTR